jgi:hypothetical protein
MILIRKDKYTNAMYITLFFVSLLVAYLIQAKNNHKESHRIRQLGFSF